MRDLSALDRLAYIGRRGMGALEFVPPTAEELETPFKVEIADLYQLVPAGFRGSRTVQRPGIGQPDGRKPVQGGYVRRRATHSQGSGQRQFRGGTMLLRTGGDPFIRATRR